MPLRRFSMRCLLIGHDDLIRRECNRMYLECCDCRRTTRGWTLGAGRRRAFPPVSDARRGEPAFAVTP
jgi:hypothetical protein